MQYEQLNKRSLAMKHAIAERFGLSDRRRDSLDRASAPVRGCTRMHGVMLPQAAKRPRPASASPPAADREPCRTGSATLTLPQPRPSARRRRPASPRPPPPDPASIFHRTSSRMRVRCAGP